MILNLKLENWKSHSSSSFSFGKGTSVLLGRMGSGKSSVLDAVCFALYGTFPKMSRRDQTTESLVNMASSAETAVVELEFEKAGKKYAVMRKVGKKSSDAEVRLEGKLMQKSPKAVTEYITGVLGVDYELFTRAIYSEQNRIDYLLSLNPKQRKGEIDWLLGLGQFDTAREAAQAAYYKLSETGTQLSSPSDDTRQAELQSKIAEQHSSLEEKKKVSIELKGKWEELAKKLSGQEKELSSLEKLRSDYQKKKTECERLEGAIIRLQSQAKGKAKPAATEIDSLEAEHQKKQQQAAATKQRQKGLAASLSSLKSDLAVLENGKRLASGRLKKSQELNVKLRTLLSGKSVNDLEKESQQLMEELDRITAYHAQLHAEVAQLSSAVQTLSSAGARCPVCDSDLSEGKGSEISAAKKQSLEAKKADLEASRKGMADKKALLGVYERKAYELAVLNSELAKLGAEGTDVSIYEAEMAKKEAASKAAELEAQKAEAEASSLEGEMEKGRHSLEEAASCKKIFEELEIASSQFAQSTSALSSIGFSEDRYEEARKAAETVRLESTRLSSELSSLSSQIRLVEELCSSMKKELTSIEERKGVARKYSEAAESMAIYKNSLAGAQSELRSVLVEEINSALSEIWPSVYPYSDYSAVKLSADEKDYRLLMEKNGEWREVDAIASGGERACLCLGLRIAFAVVLTPDVGWLILDEPTHNLDSEAVAMLSEAISRKIPSIVEQTFVITHEPALAENSEGCVFLLSRDKGKNESTKVEIQKTG